MSGCPTQGCEIRLEHIRPDGCRGRHHLDSRIENLRKAYVELRGDTIHKTRDYRLVEAIAPDLISAIRRLLDERMRVGP